MMTLEEKIQANRTRHAATRANAVALRDRILAQWESEPCAKCNLAPCDCPEFKTPEWLALQSAGGAQ